MLKELNQAPWRKKMLARIGDICTGYGKGGGACVWHPGWGTSQAFFYSILTVSCTIDVSLIA